MHIVFVTTELATNKNASGGLASFTANMARIFASKGHNVTIILSSVKESEFIFDEEIILISLHVPKKTWNLIDKIARVLTCLNKHRHNELRRMIMNIYQSRNVNRVIRSLNKKDKVDIVHFCNLSSVALFADKRIPHVIRLSSLRNIWRGANLPLGQYEYKDIPLLFNERLHDYVLRRQSYIISPSNWLADITKEYINPNVTVIESPFVQNENSWNYNIYNENIKGKKYILYYGYLKYSKGIDVIARLSERFLHSYPDMYLVLAGKSEDVYDSEGDSLKGHEWAIQCAGEYSSRVLYVGALARESLYPLISHAEMCLLPSRVENLSNACIEALALGKIVVATDGSSYEQLIEHGVNGFLCERDNADSFFEGIVAALALNEEKKQAMCMNAKKSVERLQPEYIYGKYLNYYEKVIREWE